MVLIIVYGDLQRSVLVYEASFCMSQHLACAEEKNYEIDVLFVEYWELGTTFSYCN